MQETDVHSINHVGMVVREMAQATQRFEAMGFTLTPYSAHSGAWKPGEPVKPLGSGNRCVMFGQNYLEILANENPEQPSPRLEGYLAHHQGGHIICFGSEALEQSEQRCQAHGIATSGVIPLQRDVDTPEGTRTAKFQRVQFAPADTPEGYIQVARHLTPEYIYQPRYIAHANGCDELCEAVLIVDDVPGFVARYTHYTGLAPEMAEGLPVFRFSLCSRLVIMTSRQAVDHMPGTLHPPVPGIAAVVFRCPDLDAQAQRLRAQHIVHRRLPSGRLLVPAEEALGIAVLFATS